eukprot:s749_g17.t1
MLQDICHSYAKAKYLQTGKWTGPLSEGIEKVLDYGAWGGGEPEERAPEEPDMTPPEILTFVGMPADMIEAVKPGDLVDGYPETLRQDLGNVVLSEEIFLASPESFPDPVLTGHERRYSKLAGIAKGNPRSGHFRH